MKILVTGAHFTPAYATIEQLKKITDADIVYVGRNKTLEGDETPSVESKVLPALGVKFISLFTGRLQRSFTIYTIPSLLKIPVGFIQAIFVILSEKPDVILSFGGYVSIPVIVAGWFFSIPVILHEQTLVSGLANKISSIFADKIALSFRNKDFQDEKQILTGNPIRGNILKMGRSNNRKKIPTVLIMGGNQGSHLINLTVEKILDKLTKIAFVYHISGDNKFKDFARCVNLGNFNGRYVVKKWIGEEYGTILSKVDLVICRAGINTLTELAYLGIPALVIPIPYLYLDEQNENARVFQDLGLVKMLPQSKLSADSLLDNIKSMLNNLNSLNKKAKGAKKAIIADASKRLALETLLLIKK